MGRCMPMGMGMGDLWERACEQIHAHRCVIVRICVCAWESALTQVPAHWRVHVSVGPWCWERLKAGGNRDKRGWDGWMASLTQWTWVWVSSGSWWWTGKPGVLQSMGSQRIGHDWATELNRLLLSTGVCPNSCPLSQWWCYPSKGKMQSHQSINWKQYTMEWKEH